MFEIWVSLATFVHGITLWLYAIVKSLWAIWTSITTKDLCCYWTTIGQPGMNRSTYKILDRIRRKSCNIFCGLTFWGMNFENKGMNLSATRPLMSENKANINIILKSFFGHYLYSFKRLIRLNIIIITTIIIISIIRIKTIIIIHCAGPKKSANCKVFWGTQYVFIVRF